MQRIVVLRLVHHHLTDILQSLAAKQAQVQVEQRHRVQIVQRLTVLRQASLRQGEQLAGVGGQLQPLCQAEKQIVVAQQAAVQRKAVQGDESLDLPLDAGRAP